jgi:hypothetical protein
LKGHVLFHEDFDADTGRGLGASHPTGWTVLVATLIEQRARRPAPKHGSLTGCRNDGRILLWQVKDSG